MMPIDLLNQVFLPNLQFVKNISVKCNKVKCNEMKDAIYPDASNINIPLILVYHLNILPLPSPLPFFTCTHTHTHTHTHCFPQPFVFNLHSSLLFTPENSMVYFLQNILWRQLETLDDVIHSNRNLLCFFQIF